MKLHLLTSILFMTVVYSVTAQQITVARDSATMENRESKIVVYSISLIKLIATPEKYHNKEVIVSGFLNLQFEGTAIYLHEDDCQNGLNKNGFWVNFSDNVTKEQLSISNQNYVTLRGTFDMERAGHFGLWSGTIKNITSVTPLSEKE
ncbi:MAG: hypothetical protein ABJN36_08975 [Cyclobacteriaceae bacterium]